MPDSATETPFSASGVAPSLCSQTSDRGPGSLTAVFSAQREKQGWDLGGRG